MSVISTKVDLRGLFGPVRHQGPRPTCMAFAASDAHAAARGDTSPLSCEFAFFHARRRAKRPPTKGATLSAMLEAGRYDGQPEEHGWPYLSVVPQDVTKWAPPASVGPLFQRAGLKIAHTLDQVIIEL